MIFFYYYSQYYKNGGGNNAWYIQEQNPAGDIVYELYAEDYFNSTDSNVFLLNSLDVHPVTGDILCSFGAACAIACFNYSTKNMDWAIDTNGTLAGITNNPSLTKFLTLTTINFNGYNYTGPNGQYDVRWQTVVKPVISGNSVISCYSDESHNGQPWARAIIYEIDLSSNSANYLSGIYDNDIGGTSSYNGSYKIIKENNNKTSHLINFCQYHPSIWEFGGDAFGLGKREVPLFTMDIPGDIYRVSKATPKDLSIISMRKTSGMPYWTS
jgi:hypothetical protein